MPAEHPAQLVLELASGRADKLLGRFLSIYDDLDQLLANFADIDHRNLYSLKIERLAGPSNPKVAAIMAAARKPAE